MKRNFFLTLCLCALIGECSVFFYYYFFGAHGYKKIQELQTQQDALDQAVSEMKAEVAGLEKQLDDFKKYPYYKEKIIREQLQMIKPNEVIYKESPIPG
jgi:cell division protein FtsB